MANTYIRTGTTLRVYDSAVETFPTLPLGTYTVEFSQLSGFSLRHVEDLNVGEQTIYGGRQSKVDKILRTWDATERSLGVMLSGDKGQGKSLFLRMLGAAALQHGLPVIRVTQNYPGLAEFIDSLGESLVVFDEFEKIFPNGDPEEGDVSAQTQFLSLFDGTSSVRRLYCVTVNKIHQVSDYLVNRPGRFHYHLRFDYPTVDDVRTYLTDKVPGISEERLEAAAKFSQLALLNYDHLRAIAFEAAQNPDAPFSELINDLNIKSVDTPTYLVETTYSDGVVALDRKKINFFGGETEEMLWVGSGAHQACIRFRTTDAVVNQDGILTIPSKALRVDMDAEEEPTITKVTFELTRQPSYNYAF